MLQRDDAAPSDVDPGVRGDAAPVPGELVLDCGAGVSVGGGLAGGGAVPVGPGSVPVGPVPVVPCVGLPWIGAPPLGGIGLGAGVDDGALGEAPVGGGVFGFVGVPDGELVGAPAGVPVVGAVVPPVAPGESVWTGVSGCSGGRAASSGPALGVIG